MAKKDKNKKLRRKRQEEEEVRSRSEDEKRSTSGGASQARRSDDPGDGGPPGSSSADTSDQDSSVDTSAIRSMLKRRVKQNMERPKSSLGSVKIEEFAGERSRYAKWKKAVEAQQQLYRLDEEELAMLIYLSSRRDARDCLDQRSITEYTRPGGLRLVWRLLDESFGETDEELFERAESEYALYRRLPGQPVAAYIGQMKRLKAQYARVDPDTHISDRAWAQRLLNRCSLGRRDRLDVFFSAGGLYEPLAIERALRHRCARVHEDERRTPQPSRFPKQSVVKPRSGEKGSGKGKKPFRRTYLAGEDEMEEDEAEEDLEGDEAAYQTYLQEMREEGCDTILEEPDLGEDGEGEESEDGEDEFLEAYTAGWKAKAKLGDKKKARGWRPKTSTSTPATSGSLAQKKQASTCASCGQRGHWKGDPQCPNVANGKDKPHVPRGKENENGVNAVHYTFAVTSRTVQKKGRTEERKKEKKEDEKGVEATSCPKCRWPTYMAAKYCAQCGSPMKNDERMPEGKRPWLVLGSDEEESEEIYSSGSSGKKKEAEKMKSYQMKKGLIKQAAGQDRDEKEDEELIKASPEEVLASLPQMSRAEKKAIKDLLIREEDDLAFKSLERHRILQEELIEEARTARRERASSSNTYHAAPASGQQPFSPPQRRQPSPPVPSTKTGVLEGYMETARRKDVPRKIKERMLDEFRRELYARAFNRGRLTPSSCAPPASEVQIHCKHPFERLRWSSNGDGHYASCKDCQLKNVIYFSERHGALMVESKKAKECKENHTFVTMIPGYAIVDSGCRTAVAGIQWHQAFQEALKRQGMTWKALEESESFKFGSGAPELSHVAYLYPVGLHGVQDVVRISCVKGGASDCPGLIGPSEMSRWKVVMKFAEKLIAIQGKEKAMMLTSTRHPAINLLDYGEGVKKGENFWKQHDIQELVKTLEGNPHAWAFLNHNAEAEESEASEETEAEEPKESDASEDESEEEDQRRKRRALERLERDLLVMPLLEKHEDEEEGEEDWELVQTQSDEEESITSHEFGVDRGPESSEEDEDEQEDTRERVWTSKIMNKSQRSEVGHVVQETQKIYWQRIEEEKKEDEREVFKSNATNRRKRGLWKVVEVFTWTCMISLCAVERGNWTMMEPVTLPGWNLLEESDRHQALEYLAKEDPDLLVLAWPCTFWSVLQEMGIKTEEQRERLMENRMEQRTILNFVCEACQQQRARGGAVLGENPHTSRAWREEAIIHAFEGMGETVTDMCQYGLKKPKSEDYRQKALFLRKRTRLRGTEEIMKHCSRRCKGGHEHAPVLGSVKIHGKWQPLSDFAGGYTKQFARCVLDGAEEYLKKGRRKEVFAVGKEVPEERFIPAEDEAEDEDVLKRFEDEDAAQRKKDQLMTIHRRLGHPSSETLVRMLRLAGAEKWLIEEAGILRCPTCSAGAPPSRPMAQRSDMRPTTFNELVAIDLKFAKDCRDQLYVTLSMIDLATNYHQAVLLRNRNPPHVAKKFLIRWIGMFGVPTSITLDQGGEWEAEFILMLEEHAIGTRVTGSHAAWQLGHAERHGALLATAWGALIHDHQVVDREGMKKTLACAVQAKNEVITRKGYSANALVFGRQSNFPSLLDDETHTMTTLGQALSLDTEVARQNEMRAAAKRALLHQEAQEKLKKALTRRPGGQIREFVPGEKVFYWIPSPKKVRYKRDFGVWRGPAVVIAKESHEKYFVSWRGRCLLLAAANLRGATQEENMDAEGGLAELEELQSRWSREGKKTYEDVTEQVKQGPEKEHVGERWSVKGECAVRSRGTQGRSKREAVEMMRGLKSMKKVLKDPFLKRKRGRPRKVRSQERTRRAEEEDQDRAVEREIAEEFKDAGVGEPEEGYTPTTPEGSEAGDEDEFWEEVRQQEENYAQEEIERKNKQVSEENKKDWRAKSLEERKRRSVDDLPEQFKRRRIEEEAGAYVAAQERIGQRFNSSFFHQVQFMVAEKDFSEEFSTKLQLEESRKLNNQWLSRQEVRQLSKLLDVPVSAARLHRTPRKRFQPLPSGRKRGRITVMLQETPGQVIISNEDSTQLEERPRRRAGSCWRGMTLFTRVKRPTKEEKEGKGYVEVKGEVYEVLVSERSRWLELVEEEKERQLYHEVLLLKLKASGKELDPKWFNFEEAKKFQESDKKEWEAWIRNGVVRRLTRDEAKVVPSGAIFKAPLRMVRTNKSKDPNTLEPKSRLVVPGHLDPGLGEFRTDSPTTTPTAVRMIKSICVTLRWTAWVFDVATAFLSGKETSRMVYARAPPEGLPETSTSPKVSPFEVMRIVKSAYGLSEAPRLWYLRAVELLTAVGMTEVPFCRSTFVAKNQRGDVFAICALHVDDGFLVGNEASKDFKDLKGRIDQKFNIKAWERVDEKGVQYLGMKVTMSKEGVLTDDMTQYIQQIEPEKVEGSVEEPLLPEHTTSFRRLIMRMRWPSQHILPEYMFKISVLAQKVTSATYGDLKEANKVLLQMKQDVTDGYGRISYYPIKGDMCFVSFFDAGLGKKDGAAQQGEVRLISSTEVAEKVCRANLLEFHSNKISRVVRSSMAAESCAMTSAADKQLYNRLLFGALRFGVLDVPCEWRKNLRAKGFLITDARSLFDHCHKTGHLAQERQTAIDMLMTKNMVEEGIVEMKWVPTFKQLADPLTKEMTDLLLRKFKRTNQICLNCTAEDLETEKKRAAIRKGQRERRVARMKLSQHFPVPM